MSGQDVLIIALVMAFTIGAGLRLLWERLTETPEETPEERAQRVAQHRANYDNAREGERQRIHRERVTQEEWDTFVHGEEEEAEWARDQAERRGFIPNMPFLLTRRRKPASGPATPDPTQEPKIQLEARGGANCALCREPTRGHECRGCGTWVHRGCAEELSDGKCPTPGCGLRVRKKNNRKRDRA